MMDCIIRKASELNLGSGRASNAAARTGPFSELSDVDTELGSTRVEGRRYSDSSEAYRTDDESNIIGYTYEYLPSSSSVVQVSQPLVPGCSRDDPESHVTIGNVDSPGDQTLAELKREATKEKTKSRTSRLPVPKVKIPNKAVPCLARSCEKSISRAWNGPALWSPVLWTLSGTLTYSIVKFVKVTFHIWTGFA